MGSHVVRRFRLPSTHEDIYYCTPGRVDRVADQVHQDLSGNPFLLAQEAEQLGLVTRVVEDPSSAAHTMAAQIAARSPDAIRAGKHLLTEAWNADASVGLQLEETLQRGLFVSPEHLSATKSGL